METRITRERIIKGAVLIFFGMALYMGVSCSPVHFATDGNGTSNCSVSTPCVTSSGLLQVDQTFQFNASNQVDILVVDDTSGSMTTEQNNLGSGLNGFVSNLMNDFNTSGLNWQIAVTNTDICGVQGSQQPQGFCPGPQNLPGAQGAFMGPTGSSPMYGNGNQYIITPYSSSPDQLFYNTVQRGNQVGSGDERAVYAANLAIDHRNDTDAGFFRDNSNLAVVILSDEDERSVGGNCTENDSAYPDQYSNLGPGQCDPGLAPLEDYDKPTTLISKVQQVWGGAKSLMVNSIIIIPNDTTQYPDPNMNNQMQTCLQIQSHQGPDYTAHPGRTYQQLSQMTGGQVGSICDDGNGAFANMLTNITGAIANQPSSNVITLAHTPAGTPIVTFTPQGNAVNWSWSGNQITLSQRPVSGTTVDVNYSYSSGN